MAQTLTYDSPAGATTAFGWRAGGTAWLRRLCGLPCGAAGEDEGPRRRAAWRCSTPTVAASRGKTLSLTACEANAAAAIVAAFSALTGGQAAT